MGRSPSIDPWIVAMDMLELVGIASLELDCAAGPIPEGFDRGSMTYWIDRDRSPKCTASRKRACPSVLVYFSLTVTYSGVNLRWR